MIPETQANVQENKILKNMEHDFDITTQRFLELAMALEGKLNQINATPESKLVNDEPITQQAKADAPFVDKMYDIKIGLDNALRRMEAAYEKLNSLI